MIRNKKIVPALMFHSVGLEGHPWVWSHISESLSTFEHKIALLARRGFRGVFWGELYKHMSGSQTLPDNSILLTFDDGYLDNWVYVYPVLKKYGMKATIFVNPDFVDPRSDLRLNQDDVIAGRCSRTELSPAGFLSWAEMLEMEKSGLVDIQSHSMSHTWYFSGATIVDFHQPNRIAPFPWLFWNARPERKPYYLTEDQQDFVPWGYPILEHEKSLVARRFYPDESAMEKVAEYVNDNGGRDFFLQDNWRNVLKGDLGLSAGRSRLEGYFEADNERESRVTEELRLSKFLLEENLRKQIDFICWPGGGNDQFVQRAALNVGYKAWTLSSSSQTAKRNLPGADPVNIKRIGTSNDIVVKGRVCGTGGAAYQLLRVMQHQHSLLGSSALNVLKVAALAQSFFRRD